MELSLRDRSPGTPRPRAQATRSRAAPAKRQAAATYLDLTLLLGRAVSTAPRGVDEAGHLDAALHPGLYDSCGKPYHLHAGAFTCMQVEESNHLSPSQISRQTATVCYSNTARGHHGACQAKYAWVGSPFGQATLNGLVPSSGASNPSTLAPQNGNFQEDVCSHAGSPGDGKPSPPETGGARFISSSRPQEQGLPDGEHAPHSISPAAGPEPLDLRL